MAVVDAGSLVDISNAMAFEAVGKEKAAAPAGEAASPPPLFPMVSQCLRYLYKHVRTPEDAELAATYTGVMKVACFLFSRSQAARGSLLVGLSARQPLRLSVRGVLLSGALSCCDRVLEAAQTSAKSAVRSVPKLNVIINPM